MTAKATAVVLITMLLTIPAMATKPSFDCHAAKKADEIAICNDDDLATRDLATSRLFKQLKIQNRDFALRIAKGFLATRHRCRSDAECIRRAQEAAIGEFQSALANLSGDATESVAPQAKASPNPWPDSFARRGLALGMSLSAFKAAPYPDTDKTPGAYVVCSDDARSKDLNYSAAQLYSDTFAAAHMVLCKFFWNYQAEYGTEVFEAGLVLGDTSVDTSFYFIPDEQGVLRLFWIVTKGPAEMFLSVHKAMVKAYGAPTQRIETWQNQMGNTFENDVDIWTNATSQIEFKHYGSKIAVFDMEHTLTPLWDRFAKFLDDRNSEAAKKL